MRSKLTVRGSEKFVQPPLSKAVKFKRPESMVDVQRRAFLQMREEEEARIKTEEEFKRDFLDFSYITGVDDYGLPLSTPYSVPRPCRMCTSLRLRRQKLSRKRQKKAR